MTTCIVNSDIDENKIGERSRGHLQIVQGHPIHRKKYRYGRR